MNRHRNREFEPPDQGVSDTKQGASCTDQGTRRIRWSRSTPLSGGERHAQAHRIERPRLLAFGAVGAFGVIRIEELAECQRAFGKASCGRRRRPAVGVVRRPRRHGVAFRFPERPQRIGADSCVICVIASSAFEIIDLAVTQRNGVASAAGRQVACVGADDHGDVLPSART